MKIAVFTSARSDYGLLRRVIGLLSCVFDVDLLVGGAHHLQCNGMSSEEINADWMSSQHVHIIPVNFLSEDFSIQGNLESLGGACVLLGHHFLKNQYDAVIILGDRWELFGVSLPAMLNGIPIAHISGGEITEGVIDDCIRHAHTKLAHLHFVANNNYAENVSKMGEEDWRITVCGECGLDSIHRQDVANHHEIEAQFGVVLDKKTILVTYHPATLDIDVPVKDQIGSLLDSLSYFPEYQVVFTAPGVENGADLVVESINRYLKTCANAVYVSHFGSRNYLAVLKSSAVVLGNSSSGLVEAASFGVPTVNVGNRQKNRLAAESVIHAGYDSAQIKEALSRALSPDFKETSRRCSNPYDPYKDGRNSERIVSALHLALSTRSRQELLAKKFELDVRPHEWNNLLKDFK